MGGPGFTTKSFVPVNGIGNSAAYQVSGIPYLTGSTITGATELQISFPKVTKEITVANAGSDGLRVYFNSATDGNVIAGNHFFTVTSGSSHTFTVKCKEIYLSTAAAGTATFEMFAELTTVPESQMFPLTGSGLTE
jgi:hypothetical protein